MAILLVSQPMNRLQIRPATSLDLVSLQMISQKTFWETFAAYNTPENMAAYLATSFSEEKLRAELQNENSQFYLAEKAGEVLGYLKLNVGDAQSEKQDPLALEIERIYVLSIHHGTAIGQKLYEKALAIALKRQAPFIWLGVWEKNPRAIRFYQKNGFWEFGEHIFQLGEDAQRDVFMRFDTKPTY